MATKSKKTPAKGRVSAVGSGDLVRERTFAELFEEARLSERYWLEAIELCETKKRRRSLAREIAKLANAARPNPKISHPADDTKV